MGFKFVQIKNPPFPRRDNEIVKMLDEIKKFFFSRTALANFNQIWHKYNYSFSQMCILI